MNIISDTDDIESYFSGRFLYGDNFALEQITAWYEDEKEGYAQLIGDKKNDYHYSYHKVNQMYGYRHLPRRKYHRVLGVGSAFGQEFIPIQDLIGKLYILEPSDNLISPELGHIDVSYGKPSVDGSIDFSDASFDLIICFDTLHHIPNVTRVLSEMARCLKPGGFLLSKEPINTMGDWREPRPGLTKRERGIPLDYFRSSIPALKLSVVRESLLFTMTSFLTRKTIKILPKPIHDYRFYLAIDKWLSRIFRGNITYHPVTKWQRIAPSEVFYILTK